MNLISTIHEEENFLVIVTIAGRESLDGIEVKFFLDINLSSGQPRSSFNKQH